MATPRVPKALSDEEVRHFVLGTFGQGRWTQDSPIVPDVWISFIRRAEQHAQSAVRGDDVPDQTVDLLITPWTGSLPGQIARSLRGLLTNEKARLARIATSSSRVVARLDFEAVSKFVVPLTGWWQALPDGFRDLIAGDLLDVIRKGGPRLEFIRFVTLVGFITEMKRARTYAQITVLYRIARRLGKDPQDGHKPVKNADEFDADLRVLLAHVDLNMDPPSEPDQKRIWLININRTASQTVFDSRKTVKADAAQRVFDTDGKGITFAVIDNGVDATHVGFIDQDNPRVRRSEKNGTALGLDDLHWSSRVKATYDFSHLRELLADAAEAPDRATDTLIARKQSSSYFDKIHRDVRSLAGRAEEGRGLDWSIAAPLIEIPHDENYVVPADDHGTHVAGILAARVEEPEDFDRPLIGVCPKLTLYDLRVFAADGNGDEFSILAALEFIGWLNRDRDNPVIHGVNMSLALRHDVDSFGCGRTPVCDACNQLVGAGVVVVAAAGNMGFDGVAKQSLGSGYRTVSITDPGNAEDVITVGSTHRRDPHAYGVSYFSSRGPTGDGRRKPDILAPGEKITSTIRGNRSQRLDGTSMAAPHVSGAAALLMARHPELIGQPRKIKKILMDTATDLGREPGFQGAGLLDILRALQSV
ncbi:subtilisin family serine protease [Rhizobium leguminosarum]|uniref:Subtilisin family serine protease n=1 Tax=Rhizobium leguminosarum TaxID=384 RepID=A0A7Z0E1I5_RHILE|nr:S8 family serine peptidase [Rhizobium leguminosarum]NYJ13048.1 subtilisin family serine protease [Rhizobium leguminosarum]